MNKPVPTMGQKGRAAELMMRLKAELDFDPLVELVEMYRNNGTLKGADRAKICMELMSYRYPKLKALEIGAGSGQPVVFNFDLSGNVTGVNKVEDKE